MAKKVLVVEDAQSIRRFVEVNLVRAGYEVIQADDGIEGLERIREETPDLIVLDVVLPNMDGYEVLNWMQAEPEHRRIPVVIFTAQTEHIDMRKLRHAGPIRYAIKPISARQLVDVVKRTEECATAQAVAAPAIAASGQ